MANILMVIAEKGFRDEEFDIPFKLFKKSGHTVKIASSSANMALGKLGMIVKPDLTIESVDPSLFDAVVIAGGPGTPQYLWPNKALQKILQHMHAKNGIIAAICLAPVTLARADLVRGKNCTVFETPDSVVEMKSGGCHLQKENVIVDGLIVTANGPTAASDFGEAILKLL